MIYNLNNKEEVEKLKNELNFLYKNGKVVEVNVISPQRSISFNAYLHLVLNLFAVEYGESLSYVKREIFKKYVNPDVFIINIYENGEHKVKLKSTKDLTSKELHDCLERFKNFSTKELGLWFPEFDNELELMKLEQYIKENRKWL